MPDDPGTPAESRGHREDQPSIAELFAGLSRELSELMRQEVQLAKAELREEAVKASRGGAMVSAAALSAYLAALLLSFAASWALGALIPVGFGFLIVGALFGLAAALVLWPDATDLRR